MLKDEIYLTRGVQGAALTTLLTQLNEAPQGLTPVLRQAVHNSLPDYVATGEGKLDPLEHYDCYFVEFDKPAVVGTLTRILGRAPNVTAVQRNDTGLWLEWASQSLPC